jgi:hypothetical protein
MRLPPLSRVYYRCDACGAHLVAAQLDRGSIPAALSCGRYAARGCGGLMDQLDRRPPGFGAEAPTLELYLPDAQEFAAIKAAGQWPLLVDHVRRGGLLIRRIPRPDGIQRSLFEPKVSG